MKKLAFILLLLLTWYLAGIYRSWPLMLLCVVEWVLLVALFVTPRYFRRHISVTFVQKNALTEQGTKTSCEIAVQNRGKLPVSRLEVKLSMGYGGEKRQIKKLYGGCPSGSSTLEFAMEAQHCGLIQLQMERLKLWDYLSLFFTKRNMAEQMELAVFPEEKMLKIAPFAGSWGESSPVEEQLVSRAGDACHEIRQIREYSTGDSNRHIHWNLSARTDQLWIKEYEKETNSQAQLLLDLEDVASATREEKSAFYQLLSALVLGLLEQVASVQVHWPVKEGGFFMAEVANQEQCRNMLLLLYRQEGEQGEKSPERAPEELGEHYYQLDGKLRWYQEGQLICQFTGEGLAREIQEKTFVI